MKIPSLAFNVVVTTLVTCCYQIRCMVDESQGIARFEEYLLNITSDSPATELTPTDDRPVPATSSQQTQDGGATSPSSDELLNYFRTIPRDHWSCCMLGLLAGNKGFHCTSIFYLPTTSTRNYNRPHTARHPGMHGRERQQVGHWGYDIMRSFRRCFDPTAVNPSSSTSGDGSTPPSGPTRPSSDVSPDNDDFHRCCYAATEERRQLKRAQRYRTRHQSQQQDRRRR